MARAPLPLMDYNSLVGDQQQRQQVPLMQNMPTAGPMSPVNPSDIVAPPVDLTYERVCQQIAIDERMAQQMGRTVSPEMYAMTDARLKQMGYNFPPTSQCGMRMPFQNETVQYLLLFLLAYVVIKKL